ncbi:nuclear factor of activated T-cells, cytoplasmic 3 isoform X2 [Electrophorus electricus]|uniref:nuclear factor of activated T-cells, cytoplasmic 3 isoform X2 n=1 Tax=Electrophorus electricus TaxID=8005 RepID=UPI0015D0A8F8|nr:nuclear factor of activated T-cells, cytoplasmic 3 isoform X2 [Electrophorus electricus]
MSTAKYGGSEELDFRLLFGEDSQHTALGHTGVSANSGAPCYPSPASHEQLVVQQPPGMQGAATQLPLAQDPFPTSHATPAATYRAMDSPSRVFDCPSIQITSIPASFQLASHQDGVRADHGGATGPLVSHDQLYLPPDASHRDASALCPSPCSSLSSRSWLSDASSCESFSHVYDDVEAELNEATACFRLDSPLVSPLSSSLPSPLASPQASPQVSPLVSPFGSPGYAFREEPWLRYQQQQHCLYMRSLSPHQSPYQSPRTSVTEDTWLSPCPHSSSRPSSRPTSPYGKRPHSSAEAVPGSSSPHLSPSPSPSHSPRGSVTDDTWLGSPSLMAASMQACATEVDIPSKTRRTYQAYHGQDRMSLLPGQGDSGREDRSLVSPAPESNVEMSLLSLKKEDIVEHFLSVPPPFTWGKPKQTQTPLFRSTSLPLLDCSLLPSQYGQFELKLEVQPKPHHRAHYETEGSRGAIKSACGKHPIVKLIGYNEKPVTMQMFVGTADDRHTRPHAFYQVHRITGKTVATPSHEMVISSTKVLEIPLLPENDMSASIDCAGILKLRNADIELRKGETDVGRKNTRVRAVFRVHVPQANGKVLCLQVASIPIECSQRSAQELPQIETFSPPYGSASGGEEMLITGPNITPDSKVIFLEKGPDGRTQWEVDAKPVCEKSRDTSIVVKIPSYYKRTLLSSAQVQFYVSNGKRKRSPSQHFSYVPNQNPLNVHVKQEFDGAGDGVACDPAKFIAMPAAQQLPEHLEQWFYSGGPVPSYTPLDHSYLNQYHPQDGSLGTGHGQYPMFHPSSLDFSKASFQGPQQSLSYNGQLSLPSNWEPLHGGKSPPLMSDHVTSLLGIGHHGSPGAVQPLKQSSSQGRTESYLSYPSNQPEPSSPGHHRSGHEPVDLGRFQNSSPSPESPVPQQSPASALVPTTLSLNGEAFTDPKSNSASLPAAISSCTSTSETSQRCSSVEHRLNITQEPGEEKELTFQSIGIQDITLDDVSEIIVRDLFQDPDCAGDGHSLFHDPESTGEGHSLP